MVLATIFASSASCATSKIYGKHNLISYVVDWEIPKNIPWDKMDHVAYAFAEPSKDGTLGSFTPDYLKSFTSEAHKNKVGVSISVGGWSGSKYFSSLVASESSRKKFVSNIVDLVDKYNIDGVNLDWEYPNDPNGVSCNEKNAKDTENYLIFVQSLRSSLDKKYPKVHKLITLATGTSPFNDEKQQPSTSLNKGWSEAVDSFYIMTYDMSGSWMSTSGPNSPLDTSKKYDGSVKEAVESWNKAGIPKNQIVIGVPFYGFVVKTSRAVTSSTGAYVKLASPSAVKGDKYDEYSADDCPGSKKSYSGEYQWRSVVSDGIQENKNGWKYIWDTTSATPFAFHKSNKQILSFDNAKSIGDKVNYATSEKLGGAMIWSLEMDDSKNTLLESLQGLRK
ncbi:glycoside hydrolase family 18 protein [Backusella circina FSU 941]|nr:glycoside hydrolase family 18 protein [Backusella circina FSU 941]